MWQTDINKQSIMVAGRCFTSSDRLVLERLAMSDAADPALRSVYSFLSEWFSPSPCVEVQTSGSTGVPKRMSVEKTRMVCSAVRTCEFLGLRSGDTALLCMDLRYIGAKMMVVRALVAGMRLQVRMASGNPLADVNERIDFLSIVPLQLYHILRDMVTACRLAETRCVIVGGGAVDETLRRQLDSLPCRVYSTYGMTETLSHIALRSLNGPLASERYTPFDGIRLSLSRRGTLVVHAPGICDGELVTNDVARLYADGTFTVIGRADNTVNSGGVKIQIEEEEERLAEWLHVPFALSSVPDARLGEMLVLLIDSRCPMDDEALLAGMKSRLPRYHAPHRIFRVMGVPQVGNGKIDRKACREMALKFLEGGWGTPSK